jgi:sulfate adenylyltransferase subunit 1
MALGPLRIITAGCVDDGKSTLIGRLLLDTHSIFSDQLDELQRISNRTSEDLNLALVTDGLRAERSLGITIDAGFRYFSARGRKIILADTPGHVEYTRNMVAAASNAEAAVVLVDATRGIAEQTRRHLIVAYLLGIRQFVLCLNKIDLVQFSHQTFEELSQAIECVFETLPDATVHMIPTSALLGDNVAMRSNRMKWYAGPTLLDLLETIPNRTYADGLNTFSVQWIIQPSSRPIADQNSEARIIAGNVTSGCIRVGAELTHIPSMRKLTVKTVSIGMEQLDSCQARGSIGLTLDPSGDIKRGDLLVGEQKLHDLSNRARATLCWLSEWPCASDMTFLFQQRSKRIGCSIETIVAKLEIGTNRWNASESNTLAQNEIGSVELFLSEKLLLYPYAQHRALGSGILIDPVTNDTVAAVMIESPQFAPEQP